MEYNKQLYFEDVNIGDFAISPGRTITESDVVQFAALTGCYDQIHTDAEFALNSFAGQRVAHGLIGTCYASGLYSRTLLSMALQEQMKAFAELTWKFKGPILIGDTIHVKQEIVDKIDKKPESDAGKLIYQVTVYNQRNEVIQVGTKHILIRKRPKE
ncbi:MAG: MaoC family dehydratase N-terminal domain-containing protein [Lachnospiraceae bacterium]|nr:MaoC family dehydratase N-terminal domain-containing protein [Lachnospiraceae bacterium]